MPPPFRIGKPLSSTARPTSVIWAQSNEANLYRIASPPVWTVCYGATRGVKPSDCYNSGECNAMLMDALGGFRDRLVSCIPTLPQKPESVQVALVSWSCNVGTGAGCRATLAKRANADR